jgi:hypothetical protein
MSGVNTAAPPCKIQAHIQQDDQASTASLLERGLTAVPHVQYDTQDVAELLHNWQNTTINHTLSNCMQYC